MSKEEPVIGKKGPSRKKKNKWLRILTIFMICIAVVLVLVVGGVYLLFRHYYDKTNYVADADVSTYASEEIESLKEQAELDEGIEAEEFYYVKKYITNDEGEIIGSEYETVRADELSEEEKESLVADGKKVLQDAEIEKQAALEEIASGVRPIFYDDQESTAEAQENSSTDKANQKGSSTGNKKGSSAADESERVIVIDLGGSSTKEDQKNSGTADGDDSSTGHENGSNTADDSSVIDDGNSSIAENTEGNIETPVIDQNQEKSSVYNLLLIGTDLRANDEGNGRSDSMILISINESKQTVNMISLMRDTCVNIPGFGNRRLGMAYYFGGGPLLIQTIKENFGIDIDNYAAVDFYALQDIIDSIGGITIDISADEVSVANHYITDMCLEAGMDVSNYLIQGSGSLHLNGLQAVGYCRIRYVGNGEAERTERQRRVLMTIISELKTRSLSEVDNFLNAALPHVTHNISAGKLSSLLMSVPSYLNYPIVSNRAPFTGRYSYIYADNGVLMLLPDYDYTIKKLYEIIYY